MKSFLKIKNPCRENIEIMQEIPGGKYCSSCSKKVIDFSLLNDSQIQRIILENSNEKLCGIFYKNQLNRTLSEEIDIQIPKSRKTIFIKVAAGIALTASVITTYPAQSKHIVNKEISQSTNQEKHGEEDKTTDDGFFTISGKIVSSDKQQAIFTTVNFITVTKIYSTKTDKDGFYSLQVPKNILKYESLLEFDPINFAYDRKLIIYKIEDLSKKQVVKLDYNGSDKMYGEVSFGPPLATEKSFVIVEGKKLDYRTFNKSYSMYYSRYDVHYIPKEFLKFFTTKESIDDLYIVFIKPK